MSELARFEVLARSGPAARRGRLHLRHGTVETPVFMPVGTLASVKGMSNEDLEELGVEILLGNAYHLWVRPGAERIERLGGLHGFMGWRRPILTDSGGFQVMSLAHLREVGEDGVRFRSHVDGAPLFLGPEESIRIQRALGSDVMMAFDECPALPAGREVLESAVERTTRWAERCLVERTAADNALFGIVQGGTDPALRRRSAAAITSMEFDGFAIGGLSVGEDPATTRRVVGETAPLLPDGRARYLMGVGRPEDLVEAVWRGIDMFDCVLPTRNARNGTLLTTAGNLNVKRADLADDPGPIEEGCECRTCRQHSRAYLRHLFLSGEVLGIRLRTWHNLHHVLALMAGLREAIALDRLAVAREEFWAARGKSPPEDA